MSKKREQAQVQKQENTNAIFGEFGKGLQDLIHQAIAKKEEELVERERIVAERQKKVDSILANLETKGVVKLQVGQATYYTRADTLQKEKDSFFCGLLNPDLRSEKDKDQPFFIDRDGEIFKYVLEYLTYGKLVSIIDDSGLLEKLLLDADYYVLPGLKAQLKDFPLAKHNKGSILLRVQSSATVTNGSYISWNIAMTVPALHFQHNDSTIKIKQTGLYQIIIKYIVQCSTNGQGNACIDLYVSDQVVARVYHGQNDGYQQSRSLMEILPLQVNDTIKVMYRSNTNGVADQLGNSMTILLLG